MLTAKLTKLGAAGRAAAAAAPLERELSCASWLLVNAAAQAAIFLPLVIVPAFATGHMAYVDIGWPLGLAAMGAQFILNGSGLWLRRWAVGGIMLLHGGRMAAGALVLFFPYRWPEDLPRYRYARLRYEREGGKRWPLKMLQDLVGQCWANAFILAARSRSALPTRRRTSPRSRSSAGRAGCSVGASRASRTRRSSTLAAGAPRARGRAGHPPFDGREYWLWARSRHQILFRVDVLGVAHGRRAAELQPPRRAAHCEARLRARALPAAHVLLLPRALDWRRAGRGTSRSCAASATATTSGARACSGRSRRRSSITGDARVAARKEG